MSDIDLAAPTAPAVSIIVPSHNVDPYIAQALESLLAQTLRNIEILCIDDGSTDNTLSIAKNIAQRDSRLTVLTQPNAGYGSAMNRGLSLARGEYIGILEPDDFADHTMYATLLDLAHHDTGPVDIVKCSWFTFDDGTTAYAPFLPYQRAPQGTPVTVRDVPWIYVSHPSTPMGIYRTEFLRRNSIAYREAPGAGWVDNPFWLETMYRAKTIVLTSECLYYYRNLRKGNSSSLDDPAIPLDRLNEMIDFLRDKPDVEIETTYLLKRALRYVDRILNSIAYPDRMDELRPRITQTLRRFGIDTTNSELFSEHERALYAQFSKDRAAPPATDAVTPLVSVLMPVFNVQRYLDECITTVRQQTLTRLEIIVVDDCSTDESRSIIQRHADLDRRLIPINLHVNAGYGHAMNTALARASAPYVAIVETDDVIDPDFFERHLLACESFHLDFSRSDFFRFTGSPGHYTASLVRLRSSDEMYGVILSPQTNRKTFLTPVNTYTGLYRRHYLLANEISWSETPGASYQDVGFFFKTHAMARRIMYLHFGGYRLRRDNTESSVFSTGKVFAHNVEYSLLAQWLRQRPVAWARFREQYFQLMLSSYLFTLTRIAPESRSDYAQYIAEELASFQRRYAITASFLSASQRTSLGSLIADPVSFVTLPSANKLLTSQDNARVAHPTSTEQTAVRRVAELEDRLARLKASKTFRLGRAVAAPVRLVRRARKRLHANDAASVKRTNSGM